MPLSTLLALALVELENSSDDDDIALLQRLREGTHTEQDAQSVVSLMETIADEQALLDDSSIVEQVLQSA